VAVLGLTVAQPANWWAGAAAFSRFRAWSVGMVFGDCGVFPMVRRHAAQFWLPWPFVRSGSVGQDSLEHRVLCRRADGWRRGCWSVGFGFRHVARSIRIAQPHPFLVDRHGVWPAGESAFISVDQRWPGFRVVRSDRRSRQAAWARFPAVASGVPCGTIKAWLRFGIAWRRWCVGATMAKTASLSLAVGRFEPRDAAVTHEQSDGPKRR